MRETHNREGELRKRERKLPSERASEQRKLRSKKIEAISRGRHNIFVLITR